MNKERRKALSNAQDDITGFVASFLTRLNQAELTSEDALEEVKGQLEDLKSIIEPLKDEEQEYIDNMSENLRNGDRAATAIAPLRLKLPSPRWKRR